MKSKTNRSPVHKFIEANSFIKSVIIHNNNKTTYFPDIKEEKKHYFNRIIAQHKKSAPGSHLLLYTQQEYIYLYKKNQIIYICECTNGISVSQVKMEFNIFIEDLNEQGRFPKFFTSFFDR